jgi:hypothetical protein
LWFWEFGISFQKFKQKFQIYPEKTENFLTFFGRHGKKKKEKKKPCLGKM